MKNVFLGHAFADASLLKEALTTPSCKMTSPEVRDNQRLEFLGDAVLGLLAADRIFSCRPDLGEGDLTVERTHMVSTEALRAAAVRTGLEKHLFTNKGAKEGDLKGKALADAVEAVIGAAYLDGGLDGAREVFDALELAENSVADDTLANPKGALQVWAQSLKPPLHPAYDLVSCAGPSHAPTFTVSASVEGYGSETAKAGTRKEAESAAAAKLLARIAADTRGNKENV